MNKRPEMSMSIIRRMAATSPGQLVEEIGRLRSDRENLMMALTLKLSEYLKAMPLGKNDILVLKPPGGMKKELAMEIAESMTDKLRARYGWEGVIVLQSEVTLGSLPDPDATALYAILKKRFGDA